MNRVKVVTTIRQQTPTATQTFDETYREAYSHGLETIYALENVDLAKVKPMQVENPAEPVISQKKRPPNPLPVSAQLTFDFSPIKSAWIDEATNQFLNGSWIQSLFQTVPQKVAYTALENYGLESVMKLTPFQKLEISRMTAAEKARILEILPQEIAKTSIQQQWITLTHQILLDWMRTHFQFASTVEMIEKIESLSEYPEWVEPMCTLLFDLFFDTNNPFSHSFQPIEDDIYASNAATASAFKTIVKIALTYFYDPTTIYQLDSLASWIERECAKQWIGFPEGFVSSVLKTTHHLSVRKSPAGFLAVRLS